MTRSSRRSRPAQGRSKLPWMLLAGVVFGVGLFFGIQLAKPPPRPDFSVRTAEAPDSPGAPGARPASQAPSPAEASERAPEGAENEPDAVAGEEPAEPLEIRRQQPPGGRVPRVSIVIDDLGRSLRDVETLAGLGVPLTYSVLPFETKTAEVVADLRRRGVEILCHLPMEAKGAANPGPGALLLSMNRAELAAATRRALHAVPGARGVNNHMGSAIAADEELMTAVLSVLAEDGLYFLDSRTSADTLGYSLARQMGLAAGERQVFLDASRDRESILRQFETLLATAQDRGGAIGIAHPHPVTLEVLKSQVPAAVARGFQFVAASALLDGA